jgi:hypothetical protein
MTRDQKVCRQRILGRDNTSVTKASIRSFGAYFANLKILRQDGLLMLIRKGTMGDGHRSKPLNS